MPSNEKYHLGPGLGPVPDELREDGSGHSNDRPPVADMLDEDIGPGFWEKLEGLRQFEDAWGSMDEEEE
jgi:hypothetical protein